MAGLVCGYNMSGHERSTWGCGRSTCSCSRRSVLRGLTLSTLHCEPALLFRSLCLITTQDATPATPVTMKPIDFSHSYTAVQAVNSTKTSLPQWKLHLTQCLLYMKLPEVFPLLPQLLTPYHCPATTCLHWSLLRNRVQDPVILPLNSSAQHSPGRQMLPRKHCWAE
jgi:hypothetical protein